MSDIEKESLEVISDTFDDLEISEDFKQFILDNINTEDISNSIQAIDEIARSYEDTISFDSLSDEIETYVRKNENEAISKNEADAAMKNIQNILEGIANDKELSEEEKQEKQNLFMAIVQVTSSEDSTSKQLQQSKVIFDEYINTNEEVKKDYKYDNLRKDLDTIKEYEQQQEKEVEKENNSKDFSPSL